MVTSEVVIVIPIYKTYLQWYEKIALNRAVDVLGRYPIVFCCPKSLDISRLKEEYKISLEERFDDSWFKGIETYNRLMMSLEFYERFSEFKYALIYQLDAFVFSDKLEIFCNLGFSYIGAPWTHRWNVYTIRQQIYHFNVGNGGFSLRKINDFINVLKNHRDEALAWPHNEDVFFAYADRVYQNEFKVAPFRTAMKFAFEFSAERLYVKNNRQLPFGCHGWIKFSGSLYHSLFKSVGVDIDKYKDMLGNEDFENEFLIVRRRFINQIFKLELFTYILSYSDSFSIVCFGELGRRLAKYFLNNDIEVVSIYDSMFKGEEVYVDKVKCYNTENPKQLKKDKGKIVIATFDYEQELTEKLENMGMIYGVDFVSLCREYARRFSFLGYEKYLYNGRGGVEETLNI